MAEYNMTINSALVENHKGAFLYYVLASLEEKVPGLTGFGGELETLWEHLTAFDALWREAAAALSAGNRDFSMWMRERAKNRLGTPDLFRILLTRALPKGSTLCITFLDPIGFPDELAVLKMLGNWQATQDGACLYVVGEGE